MSTRCQVLVRQEGLPWKQEIMLYHHCDGYPTGMAPLFLKAKEIAGDSWKAGRAGKVASCLCASDPLGFEPEKTLALHGDIEWFYLLTMKNETGKSIGWFLQIFRPKPGFGALHEPRRRNLISVFAGSIEAAASKAAEIESGASE